jgi:hypothetical protein
MAHPGGIGMRFFQAAAITLLILAAPVLAQERSVTAGAPSMDTIARIIARESQEIQTIRQRTPLVETYIQRVKLLEKDGSWRPDGDHYFIGRAELSKGLDLVSLDPRDKGALHRMVGSLTRLFDFGAQFLPKGFLQMIYVDSDGLSLDNYKFDYVKREFLGEVRTLVYDVTPLKKAGNGRFIGRIWVEDQDLTIVRFDGSYTAHHDANLNFHFDSWRINVGPNLWVPAFIYSEEKSESLPAARMQTYKAQTRLWGYNSGAARQEQEFSELRVEAGGQVIDKSQQDTDLSPYEEARAWDQQALDNITEKLERIGLLAPPGEIDKILNTVVTNLVIGNHLDLNPEVRCRILTTSTIESFTVGHTIVLSRGLIDVLPDEATLAAMLAKELGFIVVDRRRLDTRFAFYDSLRFDEQTVFQHFDFNRRADQDAAASAKAMELLKNSIYGDQLETAQEFVTELRERSHQIPSLISPRLGDEKILELPVETKSADEPVAEHIVALPIGGRVKMSPWDDSLELLKSRPSGTVSERSKMPFEITPFMLYLTRPNVDQSNAPQPNSPAPAAR